MLSRRIIYVFLTISIVLNLQSVLPFSHGRRQNSRFSKDFVLNVPESVVNESNESEEEAITINTSGDEEIVQTGSQKRTNGRLLVAREDAQLREILCPGANILSRYDLKTGKCSEIDTQGHCGEKMVFKEEMDSASYGYCECDFENHEVPLVFHPSSNSCYPIYSQGYCKPGEWLILSKEARGPLCQKNQCLIPLQQRLSTKNGRLSSKLIFPWIWDISSSSSIISSTESAAHPSGHDPVIKIKDSRIKSALLAPIPQRFVPLNGTGPCVLLGSGSKFCDVNEKVIIDRDDILPRCRVPGKTLRRLSIIPNACPPGSYYSIIGYCQPVWDF